MGRGAQLVLEGDGKRRWAGLLIRTLSAKLSFSLTQQEYDGRYFTSYGSPRVRLEVVLRIVYFQRDLVRRLKDLSHEAL